MPFTPAHSAIVLPFVRINPRYVSATGLIVGSVSPDFEYFLKMSVSGVHGHTLWGLLYFDLPVSWALAVIFHFLVKQKFIANLPAFLQKRFQHLAALDFLSYVRRHYVVFSVSAIAGALSHIFWDGFTHYTGYFVNLFSFYDGASVPFRGVDYPLWYALQHISTVVGLAILMMYIFYMPVVETVTSRPALSYWMIVVFIITVTLFVRFNFKPWEASEGNFVVSFISGGCLAVIFAGMLPLRNKIHG